MFCRTKVSGNNTCLQIVENKREGKKTRQRVVATLGRLARNLRDARSQPPGRSTAYADSPRKIIALKPPVVPKLASVQPGLDVGDRVIPRHSRIACMLRQRRRLPVARIQRGGSAALAQLFHRVLDFSIRQDVQQFLGARIVKPRTEYRAPARLSRAPLQSSVVLQR